MDKFININNRLRTIRLLLVFIVIIALASCRPALIQQPRHILSRQELSDIISNFRNQQDAVHTFVSSGDISVKANGSEFEASVLIAGTRDPLSIKIEITHFWGRPLLHILISDTMYQVLSFTDKKYYVGEIGDTISSELFRVNVNGTQLWAFGRGFPMLARNNDSKCLTENQIALLSEDKEIIQLIDLCPGNNLPCQVFIPEQAIRVQFSDFENNNDIQHAKKTCFYDLKTEAMLTLNTKEIVFNRDFDRSIFVMDIPPDFECVNNHRVPDAQ